MSILAYIPENVTLRPVQIKVLLDIEANWKKYDVFVIPAMVGSGKSIIATTISNWSKALGKQSAIVTPQVMLQDQYERDFPEIPTLKGRSRYTCIDRTFSNCEEHEEVCENYCAGCPYQTAINSINKEGRGVFNFHSFLFSRLSPKVLLVDEAHTLFDTLSSHYTKYLYKSIDGYSNIETIGDALIFMERQIKDLELAIAEMKRDKDDSDLSTKRQLTKLYRRKGALITITNGIQNSPKEFFFEKIDTYYRGKDTEAIRIEPIDLSNLSNIMWGDCEKIVLMSGTINDLDLRKLGLSNKRYKWIDCDSAIDASRRPINFIPIANMGYKYQDISLPIVAKYIKQLLLEHSDEKGLIHVPYSLASKLRKHITDERLVWHNNEDKDVKYKEFRDSTQPKVLVASGMAEGIDLPYDAGRWQVILKIQYPSLADNLIQYFANHEKSWYAWLTIRTLVQQCGRIVRTPTDYGVTYIVDAAFENLLRYNRALFPQYFIDALHIKKPAAKAAVNRSAK